MLTVIGMSSDIQSNKLQSNHQLPLYTCARTAHLSYSSAPRSRVQVRYYAFASARSLGMSVVMALPAHCCLNRTESHKFGASCVTECVQVQQCSSLSRPGALLCIRKCQGSLGMCVVMALLIRCVAGQTMGRRKKNNSRLTNEMRAKGGQRKVRGLPCLLC
jgi:hypothetical protein